MSKQTVNHYKALQAILVVDALTCAAMSMLLLLWSQPIGNLVAMPAALLFWAGIVLVPIAVLLTVCSRAGRVPAWALSAIILGNVLWVVGSLVLPLIGLIAPNLFGWLFLLGQAGVVAGLAALEWRAGKSSDESGVPTGIQSAN